MPYDHNILYAETTCGNTQTFGKKKYTLILKGGYLDFSHLTEFKKKKYVRKQYKPSKNKNKEITKKKRKMMGVPLKAS